MPGLFKNIPASFYFCSDLPDLPAFEGGILLIAFFV
jgi:hypothetical protein